MEGGRKKIIKNTKKGVNFLSLLLVFLIFCFYANKTFAQEKESELLILWKSSSFVPSNYLGKPLPVNGSIVYLYVIGKENNKILDLSSFPILWYIDGEFKNGAVGQIDNKIKITKMGGDYHSVRVEVKMPNKTLNKTITIPVSQPKVVLDVPLFKDQKNILVSALPYFFNIKSINELEFLWNISVGGEKYETQGENTVLLNTEEIQGNVLLEISALAKSKKLIPERALGYYKINYVKQ
jgi:hypothetical protein